MAHRRKHRDAAARRRAVAVLDREDRRELLTFDEAHRIEQSADLPELNLPELNEYGQAILGAIQYHRYADPRRPLHVYQGTVDPVEVAERRARNRRSRAADRRRRRLEGKR